MPPRDRYAACLVFCISHVAQMQGRFYSRTPPLHSNGVGGLRGRCSPDTIYQLRLHHAVTERQLADRHKASRTCLQKCSPFFSVDSRGSLHARLFAMTRREILIGRRYFLLYESVNWALPAVPIKFFNRRNSNSGFQVENLEHYMFPSGFASLQASANL